MIDLLMYKNCGYAVVPIDKPTRGGDVLLPIVKFIPTGIVPQAQKGFNMENTQEEPVITMSLQDYAVFLELHGQLLKALTENFERILQIQTVVNPPVESFTGE